MKILLKFGIGAHLGTFGLPHFATPRYEMVVFKTGRIKMGSLFLEIPGSITVSIPNYFFSFFYSFDASNPFVRSFFNSPL